MNITIPINSKQLVLLAGLVCIILLVLCTFDVFTKSSETLITVAAITTASLGIIMYGGSFLARRM